MFKSKGDERIPQALFNSVGVFIVHLFFPPIQQRFYLKFKLFIHITTISFQTTQTILQKKKHRSINIAKCICLYLQHVIGADFHSTISFHQ